MQIIRILGAVALAFGLVSASAAQSSDDRRLAGGYTASCGAARVRKPWDSLSAQEQSLYVEALGLAVKSGVLKDLSAMHLESMGETQAHHSCAFFAWHRRMLLAFESYLRDLDPKFACLTIPYYDVHSAYANAANKKCTNMYDCSPIFAALGGAPDASALQQALAYNGESAGGYAYKGAPFTNDCDDSNALCGAIVRNNLQKKAVPSGAGFGTFLDIVTRSPDYAHFLENIQFGLHNEVHNAVGGVMATFASPRDVFFYSWHGAIDMYLSVFHQCHVGTGLPASVLKTSLQSFSLATQTCGGVSGVGAETSVVMNMKVDGKLVDATQHPLLGKYFAQLGDKMWNFGDTTTMGNFSYTYELPAVLKTQVLSNKDVCKGVNAEATPMPTTRAPVAVGSGSDAGSGDGLNNTVTVPSVSGTPASNSTLAPHTGIVVVKETEAPAAAKAPSAYGNADSDDDSEESGDGSAVKASEATTGAYWEWVEKTYNGLVERFSGDMNVVAEQMRVIECMAFDNVFGVTEFSDDFVKNFHLASNKPACGKKIEAVESGNLTVAVDSAAADFKPEEVTFAAPEVIAVVKKEAAAAVAAPTTEAPQINAAYIKTAEKALQDGAAAAPKTEVRSATDGADKNSDKKTSKKHRECH